jgi:hypothetical protein
MDSQQEHIMVTLWQFIKSNNVKILKLSDHCNTMFTTILEFVHYPSPLHHNTDLEVSSVTILMCTECEYSCAPVSADSVSMVTVSMVYCGLNKNWKMKETVHMFQNAH